jgi:nucleotide-binding universal stress UspA family protein
MKDQLDYQSILVAIDFSPSSEAALKQAIWLSRHSGASLVLVHTLPESRAFFWAVRQRKCSTIAIAVS